MGKCCHCVNVVGCVKAVELFDCESYLGICFRRVWMGFGSLWMED